MLPDLDLADLYAREPISSEITRRLLDFLLSGKVRPGSRLPSERRLAEALGVGRSHVRQAIKSLTVLGLIDVRQGDGTYLKQTHSSLLPQAIEWGLLLGEKRVTDLIEARHLLEVLVAGLAAERRSDAELAEMRRLVDIMERSAGTDDFVAADVAFHLQISKSAGNESLQRIMTSIRTVLEVWISRVVRAPGTAPVTGAEHAAVLLAIESGDPVAARAAMDGHMVGATARLEATLDAHDGDPTDGTTATPARPQPASGRG